MVGGLVMFKDKGIITEDEMILISRYPDDIQHKLKDEVIKAKENSNPYSYNNWIDYMEQGLEITFSKPDKMNVVTIGQPNTAKMARLLLEIVDGVHRKPLIDELEHDGRLEGFKQYPKGARVKANGEVVLGS